jgi:hypothetical protein
MGRTKSIFPALLVFCLFVWCVVFLLLGFNFLFLESRMRALLWQQRGQQWHARAEARKETQERSEKENDGKRKGLTATVL